VARADLTTAILRSIQQGATYGYQIHRALADAGQEIRLNHLYPVLKRMEEEGLVVANETPGERGPKRHEYAITAKGREYLDDVLFDAIAMVRLAYLEYLASDRTTMQRALDILARFIPHAKLHGRTALVVPPGYLSEINFRWFLFQLFDVVQGDIFLVRPQGTFEIEEPRLTLLDGGESYVPLRDNYVDQSVLVWVPRPRQWPRPIEEATRIIRPPGLLAIILPDALLARDPNRPFEVGAFIEGVRVRRSGGRVTEVPLEKVTAVIEEKFHHVEVESVPELSFHLLVAWGKKRTTET